VSAPDNEISVSAALPAAETETIMFALMDQLIDKWTAGQAADPPHEPSEEEIGAPLDAVLYVLHIGPDRPERRLHPARRGAPGRADRG
jgi:hypothetical protein